MKFDYTLGESFYHPRLQPLVEEIVAEGIARQSEGAIAVFFEDIPQLKSNPALIQKSDGAFNYTTTDLATLAHRLETWHPDEVVYVTGGPQQLHFQQLFAMNYSDSPLHVLFGWESIPPFAHRFEKNGSSSKSSCRMAHLQFAVVRRLRCGSSPFDRRPHAGQTSFPSSHPAS